MAADGKASTDSTPVGYINSKLPKWLNLGGEERVRMETLDGVGYKPAGNTYLLQRLRLNLTATPFPWLKFFFQGQDSRVFFSNVSPVPASQADPVDLRLCYVEIGKGEAGYLNLRAGRQSLDFGEGRLVADPNWSNVGRSFDAVRLTLRYQKYKLDLFTGVSDKIYTNGFATPTPGEHFDGLYGSLNKMVPNATLEPYLFWKMEHNVKGELIRTGNLDEKTLGFRLVGKLPYNIDYGIESALQRGTQANEPLSAWAMHLVAGFTYPDAEHLPRIFAEFNRGSGDQNPRDGVHDTFDTLFPSSHDKLGVADQFCWSNIVHARAGLQYRVRTNLTLAVADNGYWLSNQRDGIYSGGKVIIASTGEQGNLIGQEPDFQARWNVTRWTLVDFAIGHIFTGEFLQKTGHGSAFNSVVLAVGHKF